MSVLNPLRTASPKFPAEILDDFGQLLHRIDDFAPWLPDHSHPIRVEDRRQDGAYLLRAEVPGVDPDSGFDVTVHDDRVVIRAERIGTTEDGARSEFRYGKFYRSVRLPRDVDKDAIEATYRDGILEIRMPAREPANPGKHITVRSAPASAAVLGDSAPPTSTSSNAGAAAASGTD
ncbi:Hsp20/alpha crystallin family protein [Rhodococcoides corynebacterioides]|uniref:Hsp20/alpha crystallin family protein n=1 Tax=Rhodococcoides corynebacterioides TaxID=53972 RepID=UPI00082A175C|nr:Hsp20/alpha crystallin family protein [Rhodococcus corynebacterioides]